MPPTDTDVANEAALQDITVNGLTFQAELPYAAGHPLTAGEAVALNQTYSENLRNNFANRVKKAQTAALDAAKKAWTDAGSQGNAPSEVELPAGELERLTREWDEYVTNYEFNGRRVSRPQGDPIDREASKMAKQLITTHCKDNKAADGSSAPIDTKSFSDEKWAELIAQVLEKYPNIREQAKVRVEASKIVMAAQIDL